MHKAKNAKVKCLRSGHQWPCSDSNKPLDAESRSMTSCSSKTVSIGSFSIKLSEGARFGVYPRIVKVLDIRENERGHQEDWATFE